MAIIQRVIGLSLAAAMTLAAEEAMLEDIEVIESGTTTVVTDVAGEDVRSADLADAFIKSIPTFR